MLLANPACRSNSSCVILSCIHPSIPCFSSRKLRMNENRQVFWLAPFQQPSQPRVFGDSGVEAESVRALQQRVLLRIHTGFPIKAIACAIAAHSIKELQDKCSKVFLNHKSPYPLLRFAQHVRPCEALLPTAPAVVNAIGDAVLL